MEWTTVALIAIAVIAVLSLIALTLWVLLFRSVRKAQKELFEDFGKDFDHPFFKN